MTEEEKRRQAYAQQVLDTQALHQAFETYAFEQRSIDHRLRNALQADPANADLQQQQAAHQPVMQALAEHSGDIRYRTEHLMAFQERVALRATAYGRILNGSSPDLVDWNNPAVMETPPATPPATRQEALVVLAKVNVEEFDNRRALHENYLARNRDALAQHFNIHAVQPSDAIQNYAAVQRFQFAPHTVTDHRRLDTIAAQLHQQVKDESIITYRSPRADAMTDEVRNQLRATEPQAPPPATPSVPAEDREEGRRRFNNQFLRDQQPHVQEAAPPLTAKKTASAADTDHSTTHQKHVAEYEQRKQADDARAALLARAAQVPDPKTGVQLASHPAYRAWAAADADALSRQHQDLARRDVHTEIQQRMIDTHAAWRDGTFWDAAHAIARPIDEVIERHPEAFSAEGIAHARHWQQLTQDQFAFQLDAFNANTADYIDDRARHEMLETFSGQAASEVVERATVEAGAREAGEAAPADAATSKRFGDFVDDPTPQQPGEVTTDRKAVAPPAAAGEKSDAAVQRETSNAGRGRFLNGRDQGRDEGRGGP